MHRFIDQMNVSITTNRTCTLKCDHCYIAPHLFKDRTQMSQAHFKQIFDQVARLYSLDHNLREVEWEVIGGETTMMPYEWWEAMLPYALDRITEFNQALPTPGALNFLTNLVYRDKRYTELFNRYGEHEAFCLYTSWEPDTHRFGKTDKLLPKFLETLGSIHTRNKIVDIILTKRVIELGPEYILDLFVPLGVTDFSIKMLSPYGSGKAFFEPNMIEFDRMSDFLIKFGQYKPDHVTYTPVEEMLSALYRGSSFQCNGNFKYDLSIEPDGLTHFNASQTADEMALGFGTITLDDPHWAEKVMFENKVEENNKLTLSHPECDQCEYLHYCNAGWYHYKVHDPAVIARYSEAECPGYRKLWDHTKTNLDPRSLHNRSQRLHRQAMRTVYARHQQVNPDQVQVESQLERGYRRLFPQLADIRALHVDQSRLYGKSILQRLWFYDDRRIHTTLDDAVLQADPEAEQILSHAVSGNYHSVVVTPAQVWHWVNVHPTSALAQRLKAAATAWHSVTESPDTPAAPKTDVDLIVDNRHEELLRWVWQHRSPLAPDADRVALSAEAHGYLTALKAALIKEQGFQAQLEGTT